jgi:hypothetical protein
MLLLAARHYQSPTGLDETSKRSIHRSYLKAFTQKCRFEVPMLPMLISKHTNIQQESTGQIAWQLLLSFQRTNVQDWTAPCIRPQPIMQKNSVSISVNYMPTSSIFRWHLVLYLNLLAQSFYNLSCALVGEGQETGTTDLINPAPAVLQDQLVTAALPPVEET